MTKKLEVYKCEVCGNMIEMVHAGVGELVCCRPARAYCNIHALWKGKRWQ